MILRRWISGCAAAVFLGCALASRGAGVGQWKHVTEADGLPGPRVQFVERDGDAVWVGTLGGLAVFRAGKASTVVKGEAVWDLLPIGEGRYWVGAGEGILLLDGMKTTRSLTGYSVGRLARFGKEGAWAVADRGDQTELFEYAGGKWRLAEHFAQEVVSDLFASRDGKVWVLLEANGLVAADPAVPPAKWQRHLEGFNVASFCEDKQGRIWCGTWGRGIRVFDGKGWKRVLGKEDATITTIREDGNGHIWAATNANGVWQFDGAEWHNHLREEGSINVLEAPGDGCVYVSSQSVCDLRVWTGKKWQTLLKAPTMFRGVIIGPGDKLWAGNTVTGLYVQR